MQWNIFYLVLLFCTKFISLLTHILAQIMFKAYQKRSIDDMQMAQNLTANKTAYQGYAIDQACFERRHRIVLNFKSARQAQICQRSQGIISPISDDGSGEDTDADSRQSNSSSEAHDDTEDDDMDENDAVEDDPSEDGAAEDDTDLDDDKELHQMCQSRIPYIFPVLRRTTAKTYGDDFNFVTIRAKRQARGPPLSLLLSNHAHSSPFRFSSSQLAIFSELKDLDNRLCRLESGRNVKSPTAATTTGTAHNITKEAPGDSSGDVWASLAPDCEKVAPVLKITASGIKYFKEHLRLKGLNATGSNTVLINRLWAHEGGSISSSPLSCTLASLIAQELWTNKYKNAALIEAATELKRARNKKQNA